MYVMRKAVGSVFVAFYNLFFRALASAFVAGGVWCGRHTGTSYWVKGVSQCHTTVVRPNFLSIMRQTAKLHSPFISPFCMIFFFLFSFMTAQCGLQFSPRGLRPSCSLMTARHLDQNTMGYLQWRWGPNSAMTTSLVRDTKSSHFTLALQVHSKISMHTQAAAVLRHYFY